MKKIVTLLMLVQSLAFGTAQATYLGIRNASKAPIAAHFVYVGGKVDKQVTLQPNEYFSAHRLDLQPGMKLHLYGAPHQYMVHRYGYGAFKNRYLDTSQTLGDFQKEFHENREGYRTKGFEVYPTWTVDLIITDAGVQDSPQLWEKKYKDIGHIGILK